MADRLTLFKSLLPPRQIRYLFFFLLLLIPAVYGAGYLYEAYVAQHWDSWAPTHERELSNEVQSRFLSYQLATLRELERIADSRILRQKLQSDDRTSLANFFESLSTHPQVDLSLELFDGAKQLVAWSGKRGFETDTGMFASSVRSSVIQGPISTFHFLVVPIPLDSSPRWYLVGKRLFDVNYPISNRFISNDVFASTFASSLPFEADFDFTATSRMDSSAFSTPMISISGDTLGYAYFQPLQFPLYQDEIQGSVQKIAHTTLFLLSALVLTAGGWRTRTLRSAMAKAACVTVGIWLLRYIMVWTDVPHVIIPTNLFEATDFASPFGYGITKSLGDLCISSLALLLNVSILTSLWNRKIAGQALAKMGKARIPAAVICTAGLSLIVCLSLRGFVATVISAVFDSILPYNDPTYVLPPLPLAVMLMSLLAIALSFVLFGIVAVRTSYKLVESALPGGSGPLIAWSATSALMLELSLLFGFLTTNPLVTQIQRLLFVVVLIILTIDWSRRREFSARFFSLRTIVTAGAGSVLLVTSVIDSNVHELDRTHVELISNEILRPPDTWLTVVMNRTLDELSNEDAAAALLSADRVPVTKLAFTQWAKSILSREGNDCSIVILDRHGKVVSDFHIGLTPHRESEPFMEISPSQRYLDVEERSGGSIRYFRGYTPVLTENGELVGGVWVELSTSRRSMLGEGASNLLKNYSKEHFESHHRKLDISEYFQGRLVSASDESMPLDRQLPEVLRTEDAGMTWLEEIIDGRPYETLYIRDQADATRDSWIALSMESLDWRWHIHSYLRYGLFYLVLLLGGIFAYGIVHALRGRELIATFRAKLLLAFIIVSVIPILVLAYYNRQDALERVEEATLKRLDDQTSVVLAGVQREAGVSAPVVLSQVTDEQCSAIADLVDTDFNLYFGNYLQATSKPEVFTAELLDERISANAYVNIMLRRKNFYAESQSIGKVPYIVGYRPMTTESGTVIGIVSVPTLFRQSEIDEELTQRNVFLFGAYALALLLSIGVGTLFVNQISSPILRLKDATRQIAQGDWDVKLRSDRKDEIGELENAFEEMAQNLKRSQEQRIRAQREAAWREMAKQVAHEIKNPLTPIKLSIQHLRRAYADNIHEFGSVLHQVSSTILEQIDALSRIASEFSHFARMPERKLMYCDVHEVLTEARNLFQQQASVSFSQEFLARKSVVLADREELRRAFINVLRNAIQAMKDEGSIAFKTTSDEDIIDVMITDTGPGIPPAIRDRLFEPNFSTKTDGMGLGLAIVKKTIDELGGTITIESAPGAGTTVTIRLLLSLDSE